MILLTVGGNSNIDPVIGGDSDRASTATSKWHLIAIAAGITQSLAINSLGQRISRREHTRFRLADNLNSFNRYMLQDCSRLPRGL